MLGLSFSTILICANHFDKSSSSSVSSFSVVPLSGFNPNFLRPDINDLMSSSDAFSLSNSSNKVTLKSISCLSCSGSIKRTLLERFQREKVTLRNFQIGDLALFLPTRENVNSVGSMSSSTSSLSSSFSSVDLSTPPPLDAMSIQSSPSVIHSNVINQASISGRDKNKLMRPWAAFTAFEESTRYFLKDEKGLTKGKEWFVGRIVTLEHFVADSPSNNPFRLPKGSVWFQVTAVVVSYQGV